MPHSDGHGYVNRDARSSGGTDTPTAASARPGPSRDSRPPLRFSLALPRDPAAGFLARQAIREHLVDVLPAAGLADLTLIVSELVTNAVRHGCGNIELRVEADNQHVKGEVRDAGAGFRRPLREDGGAAGLGLVVVERLAEKWGVDRDVSRVWFEIPVIGAGDGARTG